MAEKESARVSQNKRHKNCNVCESANTGKGHSPATRGKFTRRKQVALPRERGEGKNSNLEGRRNLITWIEPLIAASSHGCHRITTLTKYLNIALNPRKTLVPRIYSHCEHCWGTIFWSCQENPKKDPKKDHRQWSGSFGVADIRST